MDESETEASARDSRSRAHGSPAPPREPGRRGPAPARGFTLVELVVAVLLVTIGLLGLAATTGFVLRQTTLAGATTERSMALRSGVTHVRSLPFDSVDSGTHTVGRQTVRWWVKADGDDFKTVAVETVGPGLTRGGDGGPPVMGVGVADTLVFHVLRRP